MAASYLLRFDDVCPTMNWIAWEDVERLLNRYGVNPLLAVVPDNKDPKLEIGQADEHFWDRVRAWHAKGWTIAMHGYQHQYVTREAGLVGVHPYSEFAGLSFDEQFTKLRSGMAIFMQNDVQPDTWIAPAHSFDQNTLRALDEIGIQIISDGDALFPHLDSVGRFWVPQQLGQFHPMPFGFWTVCFHINSWAAAEVAQFEGLLLHHAHRITNMSELRIKYGTRRRSFGDKIFGQVCRLRKYSPQRRRFR